MFLALFILAFGIMLTAPMIFAEEDDSLDNSNSISNTGSALEDSDDSITDDEIEIEEEDDDKSTTDRIKERKKIETRERIRENGDIEERIRIREIERNGATVKIVERRIITEDGKETIYIRKLITDEEGNEIEVKIKIVTETKDGKVIRKIKREINGKEFEAKTELEIKDETEGDKSELRATLSNGRKSLIKIMPDQASDIAIQRLRIKNFTIELKEVGKNNDSRAIYEIEGNKTGRFLGIFKARARLRTEIDSETGEVINVERPWWRFMIIERNFDEDEVENESTVTNDSE